MPSPLTRLLVAQHSGGLLELEACAGASGVVLERFEVFRRGLLRHVAIEEVLVLPALRRALGHTPMFHNANRKDHAALVALCVTWPTREWLEDLRELLLHHQRVEEAPLGFYALVDQYLGSDPSLLHAVASFPQLGLPALARGHQVREVLNLVLALTGVDVAAPVGEALQG